MSLFKKKEALNNYWSGVLTEVIALKVPVSLVKPRLSETEVEAQIITAMKQAITDNLFLKDQMRGSLDGLFAKVSGAPFSERAMKLLLFAQELEAGDNPFSASIAQNVLHYTAKIAMKAK